MNMDKENPVDGQLILNNPVPEAQPSHGRSPVLNVNEFPGAKEMLHHNLLVILHTHPYPQPTLTLARIDRHSGSGFRSMISGARLSLWYLRRNIRHQQHKLCESLLIWEYRNPWRDNQVNVDVC
jgi:hypothetical protein